MCRTATDGRDGRAVYRKNHTFVTTDCKRRSVSLSNDAFSYTRTRLPEGLSRRSSLGLSLLTSHDELVSVLIMKLARSHLECTRERELATGPEHQTRGASDPALDQSTAIWVNDVHGL